MTHNSLKMSNSSLYSLSDYPKLPSHSEQLALSIQEAIKNWLSQYPHRSLSQLSRLSGIPYSTLKRIVTLKNEATMENALGIIAVTNNPWQQKEFIERYYPWLKKFIKALGHLPDI